LSREESMGESWRITGDSWRVRGETGSVIGLVGLSPNGVRYLRVGGHGFCLGAEKLEARKPLDAKRAAESHKSTSPFVGLRLDRAKFG
jgi:hypothetical protein